MSLPQHSSRSPRRLWQFNRVWSGLGYYRVTQALAIQSSFEWFRVLQGDPSGRSLHYVDFDLVVQMFVFTCGEATQVNG